MSDTKSIFKKLSDARAEFHSTPIVKTGYNDFSKYSYFELSDFLVPALRILSKNDLVAIVSFDTEFATMTVYDVTSDATIVITSPMSSATLKACQPIQSMAACETFSRRYLYTTLLEIVEHDAIETSTVEEPPPPAAMATDKQLATIQEYKDADKIHAPTQKWIDQNTPLTEPMAAGLIRKLKEAE